MSDALANALKKAVRAERGRKNWSQDELATRLGWSQSKVSSVETGTRLLYAHELPELCAVFGIDLARLLVDAPAADRTRLGL